MVASPASSASSSADGRATSELGCEPEGVQGTPLEMRGSVCEKLCEPLDRCASVQRGLSGVMPRSKGDSGPGKLRRACSRLPCVVSWAARTSEQWAP